MQLSKRIVHALIGVLLFFVVFVAGSVPALAAPTLSTTTNSTSTGDYISNAITLSTRAFPAGAPAAVVANVDSVGDTACGAVLAKAYEGPLLLATYPVTANVLAELSRLQPATIYLVGLVSGATEVAAALQGLPTPPQVVALAGADCYETAALVARQLKEKLGTISRVMIIPGDSSGGFGGSALAAAEGWPILLTPTAGEFPKVSADAIGEIAATSGVLVGTSVGPTSSNFTIEKTIIGTETSGDPGGRYDACAQVGEYAVAQGWSSYAHVGLVEGSDFRRGALVAAYVAHDDGVLLLSGSASLPSATVGVLQTHGGDIERIDFVGLGWPVYRQVKSLNSARVTALSASSGPVAGGSGLVVAGSAMDTVNAVVVGKITVPQSDWRIDSSTQLTILSTPAAYGAGPVEVIVYNYWGRSPATVSGIYRYSDGTPATPGDQVAAEALKYVGVPYLWAGASPTYGFDCSGLAMYVYGKFGIKLPHYSRSQYLYYGTAVGKENLLPGDLVFFYSPVSHVGIYVGGGLMINAPRSGDLVTIEDAFRTSFAGAKRLIAVSPPAPVRYEQTDSRLTYVGAWTASRAWAASGFNFHFSNSGGGSVVVSFNGTSLAWSAKKSSVYGIARVSVDGGAAQWVDLYSRKTLYKQTVWSTGTLPAGDHLVKIDWTGAKRRGARGTNINVDAFDVVGTLTQAPPRNRYEQTDSRLTYVGVWSNAALRSASGRSHYLTNSRSDVYVHFNGRYLAWIGAKGRIYGYAWVWVDGGAPQLVNFYSNRTAYRQTVWDTGLLPAGDHTVRIQWAGGKNPGARGTAINVDAFDVLGTLTAPPVPTRYQDSDSLLAYTTGWNSSTATTPASGGSFSSAATPGAAVSASFNGTSLTWITEKSPVCGIASVNVDGGTAQTVDLFSATESWQQNVWSTGTLAPGDHTVTIECLGSKNEASGGTDIGVDAFDVMGKLTQASAPPSPTASPVRYEESEVSLAYAGAWSSDSSATSASGGSLLCADSSGASVTVSFEGTYLAWITKKGPDYGKAKVVVDGGNPVGVDLYNASEIWQQSAWNTGLLAPGPHTVTIQWTWARNTAAVDRSIGVDAFDVMGTLRQATATTMQSPEMLVVIDPGHQGQADSGQEPVGPGSSTTKPKVSSGTASVNTGSPESLLNLAVSLKLRDALQASGIQVLMTRTTQDVNISNSQRAQMANQAGADLFVRVHANGSSNSAATGIEVLYPVSIIGWTDDIAVASQQAATLALQELIAATGATNRDLSPRSDMAGFNWSDVPVFLSEMGFMTNQAEDTLLATDAYQDKIVEALTRATLTYLGAY
jgi:N-acetylmuramoyl-L-alanine amidase